MGQDFHIVEKINKRVSKRHSCQRDDVQNSSIGMDKLYKVVLEETINRSNEMRCSYCVVRELTDNQKKYATINVIL